MSDWSELPFDDSFFTLQLPTDAETWATCIEPGPYTQNIATDTPGEDLLVGAGSLGFTDSSLIPNNHVSYGKWPDASLESHHLTTSTESVEQFSWLPIHMDMPSTTTVSSPPILNSTQATLASSQISPSPSSNSNTAPRTSNSVTTLPQLLPAVSCKPSAVQVSRLSSVICTTCRTPFGTQLALTRHLAKQHRFRCKFAGCNDVFSTKRTRDRHYNTEKHAADRDPHCLPSPFSCCCGTKSLRKDHHQRHLKTCERRSIGLYHCSCGNHHIVNKNEHVAHVRECRRREEQPTYATTSTSPGTVLEG